MNSNDYQWSEVTGASWTRCGRVIIDNPYEGQKRAVFLEERAVNIPGEVITRPAGEIIEPFSAANAGESFDLLNPETGEVMGQATYGQLYAMLHSAYMHVATKRDAAEAEDQQ